MKIGDYFSLNLSRKNSLVFVLFFTAIVIIDSIIVKFLSYSGIDLSTHSTITIFTILYILFAVGGTILLNSLRKHGPRPHYKLSLNFSYFHGIILATQISMICIILLVIIQMNLSNKYSLFLLQASTFATHTSALIFLIFLLVIFAQWMRLKKNYMVLLYIISFSLISSSVFISLLYLEYEFSRSFSSDRRPYPIHFYIIRQEVTPWSGSLNTAFNFLYFSSFFATWTSTAVLLNQYRYRIGSVKYFILIGIPLVYYAFTFEEYLGNVFSPLILNSPVTFGVIYVLTFSATKQVGALLFSLTFFTAFAVIAKKEIRNSLMISAIGIALLYSSIEINTLQYRLYPPFGIVTEAIMSLGSYLLLIGIFNSSTNVAQDAQLRREISKSAMSQLALLKTIGVREMEKQLLNKFKSAEKYTNELETRDQSYPEEDVKQLVREVLNELYPKTKDKIDEL